MTQPDMELQAIREKLQSLQAEPPAAETLYLPWSEQTAHSRGQIEDVNRQEIAIEALKQRSRSGDAMQARFDQLIAQELYRLEVQANVINEQSQKQAETILALKRSAQQASIGLRRQGIQDHPQLSIITHFLERCASAAVPQITRDNQGYFTLSYSTIDFQRAERDAVDTAHALRNRQQSVSEQGSAFGLQDQLFSEPIPSASPSPLSRKRRSRLQKSFGNTIDKALYLFRQNQARKKRYAGSGGKSSLSHRSDIELAQGEIAQGWKASPLTAPSEVSGVEAEQLATEGLAHDSSKLDAREEGFLDLPGITGQFSWLDGTIWFSGAAIARIVVQMIALTYPIVQTLFVVAIATTITFALYQVVINRSDDYSLIYRLCIVMMGLMLAGLF